MIRRVYIPAPEPTPAWTADSIGSVFLSAAAILLSIAAIVAVGVASIV